MASAISLISVSDNSIPLLSTTYNILYGDWKNIPKTYSISYPEITGANITVPATAMSGNKVRFVVSPEYGYGISQVLVNGEEIQPISSDIASITYEFTMPDSEVSIEVITYDLPKYTLNYNQPEHATIGGDLLAEYCENDFIIFTVEPEEGYKVTEVAYNGNIINPNDNGEYAFQMPADNVEISVATKQLHNVNLFIKCDDEVIDGFDKIIISGNASEKHVEGEEVTITIEMLNHYIFANMIISHTDIQYVDTQEYTFIMPDVDVNIDINIYPEDKYNIIKAEDVSNDITIEPTEQYENEVVTLTITVPEGKNVSTVTARKYTIENDERVLGDEVEVTVNADNCTFTMPKSNVIITKITVVPVPSFYITSEIPDNLDNVDFTLITNLDADQIDVIYDHTNIDTDRAPFYILLTNGYKVSEIHDKDNGEIAVGSNPHEDENYTVYYPGFDDDPAELLQDTGYRITITKEQ